MTSLVEQIKYSAQLRWNNVYKFKPKINMHLEMGTYIVKTAETPKELIESFHLRHEVFNVEFRGLSGQGLDFDKFDYYFDHLVIVHKETQRIIGTYRLNCSSFSRQSYTELEFNLKSVFADQGPHLELGRACIHRSYRKGSVISLLWRGIAEYMKLSRSKILFGCSSLKINCPRDAALVYKFLLEQEAMTMAFPSGPTDKFRMKDFSTWFEYFSKPLSEEQKAEAENLIPSLLKSYLKLGAKIACEPAFDREFDCIDMLTVLKSENLISSMSDRLKLNRA